MERFLIDETAIVITGLPDHLARASLLADKHHCGSYGFVKSIKIGVWAKVRLYYLYIIGLCKTVKLRAVLYYRIRFVY